ncbi:MAG: RsmE family RNA methyltransferase [Opitutales bacterium]
MNLILFEKAFGQIRLEPGDPRGRHIRKVLRAEIGTKVFIGFVNGLRARAEVTALDADGCVELSVVATEPAPPALPVQLLIGLPRPHSAKRILFEMASMGVQALHFFEAERSEPSYAKSRLWTSGEWKERLWLGSEQSFGTHLPEVAMHADLQSAITHLGVESVRLALDNYESAAPLGGSIPDDARSVILALGPERGWSSGERAVFRQNGWPLAHLGPYVLRVETACTAAVAAAASRLGCWAEQTRTLIQ